MLFIILFHKHLGPRIRTLSDGRLLTQTWLQAPPAALCPGRATGRRPSEGFPRAQGRPASLYSSLPANRGCASSFMACDAQREETRPGEGGSCPTHPHTRCASGNISARLRGRGHPAKDSQELSQRVNPSLLLGKYLA